MDSNGQLLEVAETSEALQQKAEWITQSIQDLLVEATRALAATGNVRRQLLQDLDSTRKEKVLQEAKLAKAIKALERIELSTDTREQGAIAMATLAELQREHRDE